MSYMDTRILSAAIRASDGTVYALPAPARHIEIFKAMVEAGISTAGSVQGFVTNQDQYLGRRGARMVAELAGQIKPKAQRSPFLFVEDLSW